MGNAAPLVSSFFSNFSVCPTVMQQPLKAIFSAVLIGFYILMSLDRSLQFLFC